MKITEAIRMYTGREEALKGSIAEQAKNLVESGAEVFIGV
jgi:hypothetical protein